MRRDGDFITPAIKIPKFGALSDCRSNKCHALRLLRSSEQSGSNQMVINVAIFNYHINKMINILIKLRL